jgi:glucosamine--fructose-6-phosphate aminotransferase (isomerizing)
MCGIVGVIGSEDAAPLLVDALKRLEYRGYDSAGVATLADDGRMERRRAAGKLRNLEALLGERPLTGRIGIGHTRWATHGAPTEANAHPQRAGRVAVVHNGLIENFRELRAELGAAGARFQSDTDTELVALLIGNARMAGAPLGVARAGTLARLTGA